MHPDPVATARELDLFDVDDGRWLRGGGVQQGRLNAGQKLHAAVQAAVGALFVISGSRCRSAAPPA